MTFAKERTSITTSTNSVETEYEQRLSHLQADVSSAKRRQSMALFGLITCLILTFVSVAGRGHTTYLTFSVLPLLGATMALREYLKWRARALEYARRSGFYERGLDRLRGAWQTTELRGEEFERENHLYQFDLQILGKSSVFALLRTTRSQAGAARLASYLLDPADLAEATSRQEAVRELVGEKGCAKKSPSWGNISSRNVTGTPSMRGSRCRPSGCILAASLGAEARCSRAVRLRSYFA